MIMKLILSTCLLVTFLSKVKADLLDGLGHDHSHEHDDDHPNSHEVNTNELLAEIHRFLPHKEVKTLEVDSFEETFEFGSSFEDQFDDDRISFTVGTGIGALANQRVGVPLSPPAISKIEGTKNEAHKGTPSSFSKSLDNTGSQQQVGVPLSLPFVHEDNILGQNIGERLSPPPVLLDDVVPPIDTQQQIGVPLSPPVVPVGASVDHTGGQTFGVPLPALDTTDHSRPEPRLPLPLPGHSIARADHIEEKGREVPNIPLGVSLDTVGHTAGPEFGVPLPLPGDSLSAADPRDNSPSTRLPIPSQVGSLNKSTTRRPLGSPLSTFRAPIRTNQISGVSEVPQVPEIVDNILPQKKLSPVIPPLARVTDLIGSNDISDETDEEEDDFLLRSDIADSFTLNQNDKDFDDIDNFIVGQGRQLNPGEEFESVVSFSPNSDFPFDGNFPRFDVVPPTSFRCDDHQLGGYYADTETECQIFHVCLGGQLLGSFTCPLGTVFNQAVFVCDWWYNVDCSVAPNNYHLNARIGLIDSDEDFS